MQNETMNAEKWQRIKIILEEAIEIAPVSRAAYLKKACADDEVLRREVESLLDCDGATGANALFEQDAFSVVLRNGADEKEKSFGGRIGNYKITGELGAGGMGAVFLAERNDGEFDQRVALKIVKKGMDSEAILRRFQIERQILANLNHSHIARLFDGGTTADGMPFFAMEYVEGEPLDVFCDRHQLSVSARLELFCRVCAAVEYAHRNQVIHRDLKPSNILVTADGTPKLLDFGIAKILRAENSLETTEITETFFRAMTPRYASPEQIRGERLTTATDVYSLGVLLYELLTGRSPYQTKTDQSAEIARFISEQMPERPSTAVTRAEKRAPTDGRGSDKISTRDYISQTRGIEPEKLRRRLRGDLDNIVLTALSKQPNERYASVEEFAADIRRHLAGLPVQARKFSFARNGADFFKRQIIYRRTALTVLLFLILSGAGAATAVSVYLTKKMENAVAAAAKYDSIAVLPFRYADDSDDFPLLGVGLADFLIAKLSQTPKLEVRPLSAVHTFRAGDIAPQPVGKNLGVETILSGVIKREHEDIEISAELTDVSDGRAIWRKTYKGKKNDLTALQNTVSEEVLQALAFPVTETEGGAAAASARRTSDTKAYEFYVRGRYFWSMRTKDDYSKAIEHFNRAVALDPNYADAYAGLADAYALLACVVPFEKRPERMQTAKDYARRALELDETLASPHATLGFIGWHYDWDWETSEKEFVRALEKNPSYATAHQWYALLLIRLGRFDQAQAEIKEALRLDPLSFAMREDQTEIFFVSRKYDETIEAQRKMIELSPSAFWVYPFTTEAYYRKGDYAEFIRILEQQAEAAERSPGALKNLLAGYSRLDRRDEFQKTLKELNSRGECLPLARYKTYAEQKNALEAERKKGMFEWMKYEFENRGAGISAIHIRPEYDQLRGDPQIQEYIRQMNLSPYAVKNDDGQSD